MRRAFTLAAAVLVAAVLLEVKAQDIGSCAPALRLHVFVLTSAAQEFGVPSPLVAAVALVESGGNANAARYEPGFPLTGNWNAATRMGWDAHTLRSSLGLMQVMGAVAFQDLHAHDPPSAIARPDYSLRLGSKLLAELFNRYGNWGEALAAYNGGGAAAAALAAGRPFNAEYVSRVFDRWAALQACMDGQ